MNLHDNVEWVSSSGGVTKKKIGEIICIVPMGKRPTEALVGVPTVGLSFEFDSGKTRDHLSFLVRVNRGKKQQAALYWPVVSKLKLVEPAEPIPGELPGIPPPGPLHNAVNKFVRQRLRIEEEKKALKPLGDDILQAMKEEKMSALSIPVAGDTYLFNVAQSKEKLQMRRARRKDLESK